MAKKPTIKEVVKVLEVAKVRIINLETVLSKYFEYKGEEIAFKEWLDKQREQVEKEELEKSNKDGTSDSVRDDKQQKVPKSK